MNGMTICQNNYKLHENKQDISKQLFSSNIKELFIKHIKQNSCNIIILNFYFIFRNNSQ